MTKLKIVITGGSGFIGTHAVNQFLRLGWEIVVIDNAAGYGVSNKGYQLVVADINDDFDQWEQFFAGANLVWHLAAEANVPESVLNPRLTMKTNVLGTTNVLQAAKKHSVPRVVFTSTAACDDQCYGSQNAYAVSKKCGEELCQMYRELYGLDVVVARLFNVWGDGQPSEGVHAPVIAKFAAALTSKETIIVYGDGEQTRDFIHVSDVINALLTLSLPTNKVLDLVYDVGTGNPISINNVLDIVDPHRVHPMYLTAPDRPSDVKHSCANPKPLHGLGWKAIETLQDYFQKEPAI